MILKPLFARVLLERKRLNKIGSIILTGDAATRHASLKCRVIDVGPTADEGIKPGMMVLIGRNAGTWLDADGNVVPKEPKEGEIAYYIVQDEDILCAIEEADDRHGNDRQAA